MRENKEVQLKVALYLRVSTDDQKDKYGIPAQRAAIEGIFKSRGKLEDGRDAVVLAGKDYEYVDDGISGTTKIDERPAFARLKEDLVNAPEGQKPFDIVAVYKIDRFARKLSVLLDVLNFFKESDVEFISATESIDTSTPFGRAMLGIMGVIAELELETIRERTQRGREQANLEGVFMGAHAPYGFQKDENGFLVKFEKEAEVIEQIFSYFTINKMNPQMIATKLTEDEVLSPDASAVKNKKYTGVSRKLNSPHFWRAERVRDILSDDIYTGIHYFNKSRKGKALSKNEWKQSPHRHESIILNHIFELAQQQLSSLSQRKALTKKKEEGNVYLLSGLLKCDHCRKLSKPSESEMMSWTGGKDLIDRTTMRYSYHYHCNRKNRKKFSVVCPVVPIPAAPLEEYIIKFIKELLSDPQAVYDYQKRLSSTQLNTQHLKTSKKHYDTLLAALPARKENIRQQHEMNVIDSNTFKNKWDELALKDQEYKERIDELDYMLSKNVLSKGYEESLNVYAKKYSKALDKTLEDKKELYDIIHGLIYQIVVYSRPKTEKDVIAGRKKEDQMIPNQVDIYLNLPQNLLRELYMRKFGVKSDKL